jgi:hypothetical protein
MGLRKVFQSAARVGFKVAGDIVVKCTYTSVVDDGISDSTSTIIPVSVMFGEFSVEEKAADKNYQPGDVFGSVQGSELTVKPKEGDQLVSSDEAEYRVVAYKQDPARAIIKLHLRTI